MQDARHARVIPQEDREVFAAYRQAPDQLECGHRGRANAHLEHAAFADQLVQATHGQDTFPAGLIHGDLRPAAEDHDNVIRLLAFGHEPGTGSVRLPGSDCPERLSLGVVKRLPEPDRIGTRCAAAARRVPPPRLGDPPGCRIRLAAESLGAIDEHLGSLHLSLGYEDRLCHIDLRLPPVPPLPGVREFPRQR